MTHLLEESDVMGREMNEMNNLKHFLSPRFFAACFFFLPSRPRKDTEKPFQLLDILHINSGVE